MRGSAHEAGRQPFSVCMQHDMTIEDMLLHALTKLPSRPASECAAHAITGADLLWTNAVIVAWSAGRVTGSVQ